MHVEDSMHSYSQVCGDLHNCCNNLCRISNSVECNLNCNPGHLVLLLDEAQGQHNLLYK
jgi:hypothetical protein